MLVVMAAAAGAGWAADVGDPEMGAGLARTWCASCHLIGTDETRTALADVPTFAEVAKSLDEARLEQLLLWLTRPHGAMPDLSLTRSEIADLLAYIGSLKP